MCDITAISAATNITGTLTLYEAGVEIDSWEIDSDMPFATVIDTFTGTKGRTYTLSLDAVVTANNLDETITCTASKKCS